MLRINPIKTKGFTLVELLVVILIIAALGGLTTIAVSKARTRSLEAVGLANLRSLSLAAILSSTERGGRFPVMRNYPWEEVIQPDGEPADWMHVVLAEHLNTDPSIAELASVFRNPAVERRARPAWLVEDGTHSHYRYNTLTAPGRLSMDPANAVMMFQTAWSDWPQEDMPIQSGGSALSVAYADGHVSRLSHSEYVQQLSEGESPDSEFYRKGWE